MKLKRILACTISSSMLMVASSSVFADTSVKYTKSKPDAQGIIYVYNEGGETLGYNKDSGITIIEQDGYAFKDLNQNGTLEPYEDWRLTTDERAENLAEIMVSDGTEGIEAIAGLMLHTESQKVPTEDITDLEYSYITEENVRHMLITTFGSTTIAANWNNNIQALAESLDYGIPINNSTDPRNAVGTSTAEYNVGNSGEISMWPSSIGLASTFDPDIVEQFGEVASSEYRALGLATALSPQIDLSTEPRWCRITGTFGEDTALTTDMARAYIDGFQTSYDSSENDVGWGSDSVNAMVKHWPSGGSGEGGRDAHFGFGKFAVYPGDNFDELLKPFTEGAFNLNGSTGSASAVMPYYTISYDQDDVYGENVANAFSRYIISDLLRDEYDYDGVVCTDWGVTHESTTVYGFGGRPWGVEDLTNTELHYKVIMAGCDQFGKNNDKEPIIEAYQMIVDEYGKSYADNRFEQSARRILVNIYNTGLFENPYLDAETSEAIVGNAEYMEAGYDAQLKSVVMIKNKDNIISESGLTGKNVYVADFQTSGDSKGTMTDANKEFYGNYFGSQLVDDTDDADVAIVVMSSPSVPWITTDAYGNLTSSGYSYADLEAGGNGYVPISLQYGPYTATLARENSIAASPEVSYDGVDNRSYLGKTVSSELNEYVLSILESTKEDMGDKPVIVYMKQSNPMVWSEVEPLADAIITANGIQTQAAMDIITGATEPTGMLPMQQPANMEAVETQYEDVAHDMECYVDVNDNTYDFGFGLCWSGEIGVDTQDSRFDTYVAKYRSGNDAPSSTDTSSTTSTTSDTSTASDISTTSDTGTSSTTNVDSTTSATPTTGKTTGTTKTPKTGDYTPIFVIGSFVAGVVLIIIRTKKYNKIK